MSSVRNPVLPGCHPDPSVCRVGDDYYLVTSTFEYFPGLPVFHSTDLAHWEPIGHVITRAGQLDYAGIASSGGLYAPTIRHHDGRLWVVCTLVDPHDASRGGNFLVTAEDPAGPWSDPVWLDVAGIDPSVAFGDDGRAWLHGTRLARDPAWHDQTEVWVRELDLTTLSLVGPEAVVWTGAVRGAVWAEGPHLYQVDGRWCLLAAEGGTEFHHAVSVARGDAPTGPFAGCPGNPVLTHRHLGRGADVVGVGHADLVQAVDGSWWAVLLGMRPYGAERSPGNVREERADVSPRAAYHYPLGRETFLVPVVWEDGWPVFAPGLGRVPAAVEVPFATTPTQGDRSGVVLPDDLRWTSLRGPADFATPFGEGWRLRLRPATLADPVVPAFLGVRQQHRDMDAGAVLQAALRPGEEVGLVVRQSEDDHIRLGLLAEADGLLVRVIHRRGGAEEVLGEHRPGVAVGAQVRLGVSARGTDYAFQLVEPTGTTVVATADGRLLDSVATGGFLGLWLGVYGTTNGGPEGTVLEVGRFECCPVAAERLKEYGCR